MAEITIVGTGIQGRRHMTQETVAALSSADVVYHLVTGREAVDELMRLNPNSHGLFDMYSEGALDLDVYYRIVSFLLARAMPDRRVVFAVMGHPSIYVAATHLLREHGPRWGVQVRVMAGVSAVDVMLLSLNADIGSTGMQVLDANRLVSYQLVPETRMPAIVFQIGCFGSGYITRSQVNAPDRLAPLAAYLQRFYPAAHPVDIVECDMGFPHQEQRYRMPLAELANRAGVVTYNSTLFIPPAAALQVLDPAFQHRLVDPAAVGALVAS
jgi:uncharacterized protein YabN with tetrapyrrole methylase and pyrophosphatase domain